MVFALGAIVPGIEEIEAAGLTIAAMEAIIVSNVPEEEAEEATPAVYPLPKTP